jgi:hypothetical protein
MMARLLFPVGHFGQGDSYIRQADDFHIAAHLALHDVAVFEARCFVRAKQELEEVGVGHGVGGKQRGRRPGVERSGQWG